jgi:hypothetical protein
MTLARLEAVAWTAAGFTLCGFLVFLAWVLYPYHNLAVALPQQTSPLTKAWAEAAPSKGSLDKLTSTATAALPTHDEVAKVLTNAGQTVGAAGKAITDTATNLNRPCKGVAGADACGTLAQINKTVIKAGDAIVTTQDEEKNILPHTTSAMDALKDAAGKLAGTADQATETLDTMNSQLKDAAINQTFQNFASVTGSAAGLSHDLYVYAHPVLNPDPCKTKGCTFGRVVGKVVGYLGVAATASNASEWFRAIPVKVTK